MDSVEDTNQQQYTQEEEDRIEGSQVDLHQEEVDLPDNEENQEQQTQDQDPHPAELEQLVQQTRQQQQPMMLQPPHIPAPTLTTQTTEDIMIDATYTNKFNHDQRVDNELNAVVESISFGKTFHYKKLTFQAFSAAISNTEHKYQCKNKIVAYRVNAYIHIYQKELKNGKLRQAQSPSARQHWVPKFSSVQNKQFLSSINDDLIQLTPSNLYISNGSPTGPHAHNYHDVLDLHFLQESEKFLSRTCLSIIVKAKFMNFLIVFSCQFL